MTPFAICVFASVLSVLETASHGTEWAPLACASGDESCVEAGERGASSMLQGRSKAWLTEDEDEGGTSVALRDTEQVMCYDFDPFPSWKLSGGCSASAYQSFCDVGFCANKCGTCEEGVVPTQEAWAQVYSSLHPGELWLDTRGERIRAHQPHVFGPVDGVYYWYGLSGLPSAGGANGLVNLYTSKDLYNWDYRGGVWQTTYNARPSMLGKNPKTGKYVMWAKGVKSFQCATADSLLGPFKFEFAYDPELYTKGGDSQSFLDPNGVDAYIVYSQHPQNSNQQRVIKVIKLDDAWTGLSGTPVLTIEAPPKLEAPCPFYSPLAKKYFIWASRTSGWKPNKGALLVADNMLGPWNMVGSITDSPSGDPTSFSTQGSHIHDLGVDGDFHWLLYMGDRYVPYQDTPTDGYGIEGSRYIFLLMKVAADGNVTLNPPSSWQIPAPFVLPTPTPPPTPDVPANVMGVDGCPSKGLSPADQDLPMSGDTGVPVPVRCCSMDGSSCESKQVGCHSATTYDDATAWCLGEAMRLCSKAEMNAGVCCKTGCGFDKEVAWTSTLAFGR